MGDDLVILGGAVRTNDPAIPRAGALAIAGDRIAWVGSDDDARDRARAATEVIDAGGGTVLPGFVDAHNHVRLGANPGAVSLFGATSLGEIHARIADHLVAHPDVTWIEGEGWNYGAIPGGAPTATMLEGVTGGRPAFLFSYDVHTVWLNREAMRAFGIDGGTDRLPWGTVERDRVTGEPTGYVHDFAVLGISEDGQRALEAHVPGYGVDTRYARMVESLDMAARFGITTIVEPQNGLDDLELFARARDGGDLRSRLVAAMLCLPGTTDERLDALGEARARFDGDRLRVQAIKLYIDDVIEPHTAAMLAPYANAPDTAGDTFWDPEAYAAFVVELERRGWQVFTHATGDRGIRVALDAVARAREVLGPAGARHQVVHVECVHPDDVGRFGALGVVACMQPRHCAPDIVGGWRANVGAARERYAWPFRSIEAAGGVLAFSSDWNVAEMDPMFWLYTAITRAAPDGTGAWNQDETVDLAAALRASTWGSAYSIGAEGERGTLTPGTAADVAVLSRDLGSTDDPREILDTHVTATLVAGQVIHRA
ncbi:MAG TPA: amidohydrolase [Actinomycetota bacterium]|nr:amidohydrolase [Actinomycetota bacterium]